ncbi:MAG: ornithine cyclodeaminase family protein [Promethearchaeota archaeon]
MTKNSFKILSANDVKKALPMKQAIEIMKEAYAQLSLNQVTVPDRTHLDLPEHNGGVLIMSAHIPKTKRVGLKFISIFNDNPKQGLPVIQAIVVVMDATNGRPLALLDGSYLTALRTGAGSGAATDLLARKNAQIAAIFGAGVQGRTQLEAVCAVRSIQEAFVFDINPENAKKFVDDMSEQLSIPIHVATSNQELKHADIICTATTALEPVFSDENLKEGAHINAIGSYKPHIREIPEETVLRAKVVVDHRESCLLEAGDLIIPLKKGLINENHIYAEIGELVARGEFSRTSQSEITMFKSVGNAVQDLAAAVIPAQENLGVDVFL